jgi:hypothetical protein
MVLNLIQHARTLRSASILFLTVTLVGCLSGSKTLTKEEAANYSSEQTEWLTGLREGMRPIEVRKNLPRYNHYIFNYSENGTLYSYIQGRYPVTETLYGLLFKDDQLVSILLDQPVTELDMCRSKHFMEKDSWPFAGFEETVAWIEQQNMLGSDVSKLTPPDSPEVPANSTLSAGEMAEIITHLPLVILAAPGYGLHKLFGKGDDEERQSQIMLGKTSREELVALLGNPLNSSTHETGEILQYRTPDARFGVSEGTVRWSEHNWWGTPTNHRTKRSDATCVPAILD